MSDKIEICNEMAERIYKFKKDTFNIDMRDCEDFAKDLYKDFIYPLKKRRK